MKSKIIISSMIIAIGLLLGISFLMNKSEKVISTITLDINPSIKIELNKNNKVLKITALNDDAKKIVNLSKGSTSLEETIEKLSENLAKTEYAKDDNISVLININGEIEASEIENLVASSFIKSKMNPNIIIQESTKTSDKNAKKYNISEGKAAFIEEIIKEKKDQTFESLKDKSITELLNIKNNYYNEIEDLIPSNEIIITDPVEEPTPEEIQKAIVPKKSDTSQSQSTGVNQNQTTTKKVEPVITKEEPKVETPTEVKEEPKEEEKTQVEPEKTVEVEVSKQEQPEPTPAPLETQTEEPKEETEQNNEEE